MFNLKRFFTSSDDLVTSELFDENTFYKYFLADLEICKNDVIIESPYMTSSRMQKLYPLLEQLLQRGVKVYIITRDPVDHDDEYMRNQATNEILYCKDLGIQVILLTGYHHRKIAILDRTTLWEEVLTFFHSVPAKKL